jgi:hypothetical protein
MRKSANQLGNPDLGENYQKFLKRGAVTVPSADYFPTLNLLEDYGASLILLPQLSGSGSLPVYHPNDGSADFTVTRNSIGTYFDRDGILRTAQPNEPRLDYDPETREFKGVLVEPAATNLINRSEDFLSSPWVIETGASLIGTVNDSPTSSELSYNLSFPPTTNIVAPPRITYFISLNANTYTFSVFLKSNEGSILLYLREPLIQPYMQPFIVDNEWRRFSVTFTTTSTRTCFLQICNFTDNISKNFLVYGAQLEIGSRATSYIPTSGATVTRQADVITRNNISHLIGQTEGSIFLDVFINKNSENLFSIRQQTGITNRAVIEIDSLNRIIGYMSPNNNPNIGGRVRSLPIVLGNRYKIVFAYKSGNNMLAVNGQIVETNSQIWELNNSMTDFSFSGFNYVGHGNFINRKGIAYFNRRITDEEAINLTKLN